MNVFAFFFSDSTEFDMISYFSLLSHVFPQLLRTSVVIQILLRIVARIVLIWTLFWLTHDILIHVCSEPESEVLGVCLIKGFHQQNSLYVRLLDDLLLHNNYCKSVTVV